MDLKTININDNNNENKHSSEDNVYQYGKHCPNILRDIIDFIRGDICKNDTGSWIGIIAVTKMDELREFYKITSKAFICYNDKGNGDEYQVYKKDPDCQRRNEDIIRFVVYGLGKKEVFLETLIVAKARKINGLEKEIHKEDIERFCSGNNGRFNEYTFVKNCKSR